MAGTISFGGLSTGLDSKNIIEQLTQLRQNQLVTPLTSKVSTLKTQAFAFASIASSFKSLKDSALVLKETSNTAYSAKSATSSISTTVSIGSLDSSKAINGTYNITDITQLAQSDRVIFNGVADDDTTQFGTGTLDFTYQGATTQVVIDSSNNTLQGIATAINDADMGITAAIINDGGATPYRLTLTSDDTGADATITQNIASILSLTLDAAASALPENEPFDAAFELNGLSLTSATNSVSGAIPGLSFSLLDTDTTNTIKITVQSDTAAISNSIQSFLDAYNGLRASLKGLISPDPATGALGPVGHDLTLTAANVRINQMMGTVFTTLGTYQYDSLAKIGITSDGAGGLVADSAKLATAIQDHPTDVRLLFQGTALEDGIAEKLYNYVDGLTNPLGIFAKKQSSIDSSVTRLNKLKEERQRMVDNYKARLEARFNALEKAISILNSSQAALDSYTGVYSNSANQLL